MRVFSNIEEALLLVSNSNLSKTDKICKIDHILHRGIAKVNDTIVVVDEYKILE